MLETIAAAALWCVVVTHASAPAEHLVVARGFTQNEAFFSLEYVALLPEYRARLELEPCGAVK